MGIPWRASFVVGSVGVAEGAAVPASGTAYPASSKRWKQRFESVLGLLDTPHTRWGDIHLDRKAIQVVGVQSGTETELRHFLESIVLQVNSELSPPEAPEQGEVDEVAQADREMTAAFRAFADD